MGVGGRYPGAKVPEYLEKADLPGTYGFDPLGLGVNPENLAWYHEAEKTNGRWAMAACAGILFTEATQGSNWVNAGAEVPATATPHGCACPHLEIGLTARCFQLQAQLHVCAIIVSGKLTRRQVMHAGHNAVPNDADCETKDNNGSHQRLFSAPREV